MGKKAVPVEKDFKNTDYDRIGFFQEPSYVSIGDPYQSPKSMFQSSLSRHKGVQFKLEHTKKLDATLCGLFRKPFERILEGEAYLDTIRDIRQFRNAEMEKIKAQQIFKPPHGRRLDCGKGSYCGTINPCPPAMKWHELKPVRQKKPFLGSAKFCTSPGKKGTGYGYIGVTIGGYPEYKPDPIGVYKAFCKKEQAKHDALRHNRPIFKIGMYPKPFFWADPYTRDVPLPPVKDPPEEPPFRTIWHPTHPAKWEGGMKAGTFDPYPVHSCDLYSASCTFPKEVRNRSGASFKPNSFYKGVPQRSILKSNVYKKVNETNYKEKQKIMNYRCVEK